MGTYGPLKLRPRRLKQVRTYVVVANHARTLPGLYGVVLLRGLVDLRGPSSISSSLLRVGSEGRGAHGSDMVAVR